jgi:hypothetical protein
MIVHLHFAAIKGIKPHEWILRFVFGGAVCVVAGIIAQIYGPTVGGLFLAFPAIFPAGASLVEAHEKQHKARAGFDGTHRGRLVAAIDALGAALGCVGLAGFALVFWLWTTHAHVAMVFLLATGVWLTLATGAWLIFRNRPRHNQPRPASTLVH